MRDACRWNLGGPSTVVKINRRPSGGAGGPVVGSQGAAGRRGGARWAAEGHPGRWVLPSCPLAIPQLRGHPVCGHSLPEHAGVQPGQREAHPLLCPSSPGQDAGGRLHPGAEEGQGPSTAPEQGSRTRTWRVPARPAWGARGPCVAVAGPRLCRLAPHSCRILHGGLWAPPAGATLPTAVAVRPHAPPGPAPGPCAEALVAGGGARPVLCCPLTLSPSWGGQPWLWRGMGRQPSAGLC